MLALGQRNNTEIIMHTVWYIGLHCCNSTIADPFMGFNEKSLRDTARDDDDWKGYDQY